MNVERLIEQGNLDLALEKCMIILKEDLDNPDYWYLLGKIFRINKNIEEAKETFYKSILLNPSSDAFFDIKAIGLPENRKFIRQIKSDKFYQYILKKMQGVSKTEMSVLINKKKNNENLPPPPPPPPPDMKKSTESKIKADKDIKVIDNNTIKKLNTPPRKVKEDELEIEKREELPLQIQDLADEIEEEETLDSIEKKSAPIEEVIDEIGKEVISVKDEEKQIDVDDIIEVSKAEVENSETVVPDIIKKAETIEPEEKPLHITEKKEEEKEKDKEMTESMDLIIDALKTSATGKKTQDMSDIKHIEHLVEIEIVSFIQVSTGKDLIQAGDDTKRKLCDTIWNEHKKLDQKMTACFIEFEKSVLLGLAKNGLEITAFGDRRKSGVIRVEINKLMNKILRN